MHEYINYELSFEVLVIPFNVCICRPQKTKKKEKEALATSSDSGSESEERSTDSDEPEGHVKQRKFGPELWHNVVLQEVEKLPSAKEGMSVFELANVEKKELHNALKDGRKWKKNCPTKWKGHVKFATQTVGCRICVLMTTVPTKYITELSTQLSLKRMVTNARSVAQTVNTYRAMHEDT